jgi:hypothetical protein
MKIMGGIKGIANNQRAFDEYFLTSGEMAVIVDEVVHTFDIQPKNSTSESEHYQLR